MNRVRKFYCLAASRPRQFGQTGQTGETGETDRASRTRRLRLLLVLSLLPTGLAPADTVYQTNAQGKDVVIQRDAIVVKEDSSFLTYKHFELKERRVVKVRLNKGSLPYSVDRASAEKRRDIVETWKRFGYKAVVTDLTGKTTRLFDVYLDFYPPGGRGSLLESVPPRTTFPVELVHGGVNEIEFSEIDRIEFQGDRLRLTLRKGQTDEGRFLIPTEQPAEARILGITEEYDAGLEDVFDFAVPLARLKEIKFEP